MKKKARSDGILRRSKKWAFSQNIRSLIIAGKKDLIEQARGGGQPNINQDILKQFRLPFPSFHEQNQIVRYLDWQNSRLNKLINAKKKEIALLEEQKQALISQAVTKGLDPHAPLKDSGIDWIGQIPEHWEIKRIKNLFSLRDERNYRPLNEVNLLSLYASKGVLEHSQIDKIRGNKASNADNYKLVYRDDIVVNIILCWMGAIGRSSFNGVTSPAYDVYKPNNGVNCNYYHHYFRMKNFSGECYKVGRGIMDVRWRTYSEDFTNIKVLTPPINEQSKIAEYAEKISGHTNKLIEVLTHYVSFLQEYRTRLVADVVTGQIDVRHIAIPNYETVTETIDQPETDEDSTICTEDQ